MECAPFFAERLTGKPVTRSWNEASVGTPVAKTRPGVGVDVAIDWTDSTDRDPRLSGLKLGQRHLDRTVAFLQLGECRRQLAELGHLCGPSRGGTFHPTTTSLI